jgi:FAD/FMN-containing dehydrogenase
MQRRRLLELILGAVLGVSAQPVSPRVVRDPTDPAWRQLQRRLGAKLAVVQSPLARCAREGGAGSASLFASLKNPYYLGDEPGLTQTLGWTDAWTSQPSHHCVAAQTAADVATAVAFARKQRVRLVVKGGGHSYFGNSNAPGSLLVWTRRMRGITLHDDFAGHDCPRNASPVPAVTVGSGALWGHVYQAVSARAGRYVQGGGCLTVGVAGFVLGGGFGSFSKAFGTGAGNLLEAEVVTADGMVRIVNSHREPDLFFALKGGGGGSFGIVTRLTLRTHALPTTMGGVLFSVTARSAAAWRKLVNRILAFYAEQLFSPTWGEILRFEPGRKLVVSMLFQGLSRDEAQAVWAPFLGWLRAYASDFDVPREPAILAVPGRAFWDAAQMKALPGIVLPDDRPGAPASNIFWTANLGEAGQVLHAYQSAWLPADLLAPERRASLADALISAAAAWPVALHTNKGLAGGDAQAIERTRDTAMNAAVLDAFALLICAADGPPAWPGIPGREPDVVRGRYEAERVNEAMAPIRQLVPGAGAYLSEADYFGRDWQQAYWGANTARLMTAKQRYDPDNLFRVHHGVEAA